MSDERACCIACECQCRSHHSAFTSHEDDFEFVSRDIEKLEDIIHHFHTVKSRRLRHLNAISSSTRNVPNEILTLIFRSVCSSAPTTETGHATHGCPQITLGAVSSHWRNVVRNVPELWGTFSVKISRENLQNTLPLLRTYLDNNRTSFDAVHLGFASSTQYWSGENLMQSLKDILLSGDNAPIIRAIDLELPPHDWLPVILNCRSIKALTLYAPDLTGLHPWSQSSLTTLHLKQVPVNTCFDVLLECPALRRFSCTKPSRATSDCVRPNQHHSRERAFSHLEYLSWYPANQHLWNDNLLEHYHFPAVRRLTWTLLPGKYHWPYFYRFINLLEPNLRSLEFSTSFALVKFPRWFEPHLLELPTIDRLTFLDCPSSLLPTVLNQATHLPSLLCFEWLCLNRKYDAEDAISILDQFHRFLFSKKENGAPHFRLEIAGLKLPWTEYDRGEISRLMDDSEFKVEVVNDGVIMELRDS